MSESQNKRGQRKHEILEALAMMLESSPGNKITTAALAAQVGVSEAALYRHFPSKAKMFDALLDFTEETIFSRVSQINDSAHEAQEQCRLILEVTLQFAELNPGICRILTGDALVGEHERLKKRANQILARLETQLKQLLREAEVKEGLRTRKPVGVCVDLMMIQLDGRLTSYVRSGFERKPRINWEDHWQMIVETVFVKAPD
ncbi:MAG: nucleoid occlusion factor SlmA [Pseudomonadales bacterium]